jgi:hypothetical protein
MGRPGTSRNVPPKSHLSPTLRVFVSPCGNRPYDFRKTQSRDVPGTFGKISFLASLNEPPSHQGTKAPRTDIFCRRGHRFSFLLSCSPFTFLLSPRSGATDSHGENTKCQRASNRSRLGRFCALLDRLSDASETLLNTDRQTVRHPDKIGMARPRRFAAGWTARLAARH